MKYENFEQIKEIVAKIKKQEEKLTILQRSPNVIIKDRYEKEDIYIGTMYHDEDELSQLADEFITILIKDSHNKISNFNSQLAKL